MIKFEKQVTKYTLKFINKRNKEIEEEKEKKEKEEEKEEEMKKNVQFFNFICRLIFLMLMNS